MRYGGHQLISLLLHVNKVADLAIPRWVTGTVGTGRICAVIAAVQIPILTVTGCVT